MHPTRFEEANIEMQPPKGTPEGEIFPVWAFVAPNETVLCFKPSPEDIARIVAGAPVWLCLYQNPMPPVRLMTETPFISPEPDERRREEIADGADHCGNCHNFVKESGKCLYFQKLVLWHYGCDKHDEAPPIRRS